MSTIEDVIAVKGIVCLVIPPSGDHQQRFVPMSRSEAHELIQKLCTAVSAANAQEEVRLGQVPNPQPPSRQKGPAVSRKRTPRGK